MAVKTVWLEVLPWVRITGAVLGVEKTTFNFVKSVAGAPGARPMENLISVMVSPLLIFMKIDGSRIKYVFKKRRD